MRYFILLLLVSILNCLAPVANKGILSGKITLIDKNHTYNTSSFNIGPMPTGTQKTYSNFTLVEPVESANVICCLYELAFRSSNSGNYLNATVQCVLETTQITIAKATDDQIYKLRVYYLIVEKTLTFIGVSSAYFSIRNCTAAQSQKICQQSPANQLVPFESPEITLNLYLSGFQGSLGGSTTSVNILSNLTNRMPSFSLLINNMTSAFSTIVSWVWINQTSANTIYGVQLYTIFGKKTITTNLFVGSNDLTQIPFGYNLQNYFFFIGLKAFDVRLVSPRYAILQYGNSFTYDSGDDYASSVSAHNVLLILKNYCPMNSQFTSDGSCRCRSGYEQYNQSCRLVNPNIPQESIKVSVTSAASGVNKVKFIYDFTEQVKFRSEIQELLKLRTGQLIPYTVLETSQKRLVLEFEPVLASDIVESSFSPIGIMDNYNSTIIFPKQYTRYSTFLVSESEKKMIEKIETASQTLKYVASSQGIVIAACLGLLFLFLSLVDFIQITTLYIFLNIRLPGNLVLLLETFYVKSNAKMLLNEKFLYFLDNPKYFPSQYGQLSISSNFFINNLEDLGILLLTIIIYKILCFLSERQQTIKTCLSFSKLFAYKFYANAAVSYLGIQNKVTMSVAVGIIFRKSSVLGIVNSTFCITTLILCLCFPFIHVAYIDRLDVTRNRLQNLYLNTKRNSAYSKRYIMLKFILGPMTALCIILTKTAMFITVLTVVLLFNLVTTLKVQYNHRSIKVINVIMVVCHILYHLLMIGYALEDYDQKIRWNLGYVSLSLIAVYLLLKVVEIVMLMVFAVVQKCSGKNQVLDDSSKVKAEYITEQFETTGLAVVPGRYKNMVEKARKLLKSMKTIKNIQTK